MTDLSIIITQTPTALFILYLVWVAARLYNSSGVTLQLLVVLGAGMGLFAFATVFQFIYSINLVNANNLEELQHAYSQYYRSQVALAVIAILSQSGYNVSHWIFAMKYWSLACKIENIKRGKDFTKQSKFLTLISAIGTVLNIASAIICKLALLSKKLENNIQDLAAWAIIFTLPLFASFWVLFIAFRKFDKTKSQEQTINNKQVLLLSIGFLIYFLAVFSIQLEALIGALSDNRKMTRVILWTFEVNSTAFWISDILLSIVLFQLLKIQSQYHYQQESGYSQDSRISEKLNEDENQSVELPDVQDFETLSEHKRLEFSRKSLSKFDSSVI